MTSLDIKNYHEVLNPLDITLTSWIADLVNSVNSHDYKLVPVTPAQFLLSWHYPHRGENPIRTLATNNTRQMCVSYALDTLDYRMSPTQKEEIKEMCHQLGLATLETSARVTMVESCLSVYCRFPR